MALTTLGHFGDKRLQDCGAFVLDRLLTMGQTGVRVRPLGGNRAGEIRIGRFLRNDDVTPGEMVRTARAHTAGLVQGRHILAIQDTTSLRDDGDQTSLQLHPTIAVDADDGTLLGLVHAEFFQREGGKRASCGKRSFDQKESRRWLTATEQAAGLRAAGAARVTVVADREGDIYDEFALRPANTDLVIRANYDRVLAGGKRLFTCTDALAELGRNIIAVPAGPGRPARTAVLVLKASVVTLKRPMRNRAAEATKLPPKLDLWFVEAREINPPHGVPPLHWRLLTTHAVTSLADAKRVTGYYAARWTIEQLFRVMKTKGFDIEAVRLAHVEAFENLAAAILIAAVQMLQMVRDRDGLNKRPLEDVFEPSDRPALEALCPTLEGKTAKQQNPHRKGSLAYACWVCARLGGWTCYYGKPGPVVMLAGYYRFKAIEEGWALGRLV
jgi:hypothetical protein